ncbi:MAG: hypothetical protein MH204_11590 [Fimbriimonadaceae bacterium]|nr:hypothetical protein [Fimbriimonadaceae bacterium]
MKQLPSQQLAAVSGGLFFAASGLIVLGGILGQMPALYGVAVTFFVLGIAYVVRSRRAGS